ncbi:60S ribosomal protein L35a-4 [Iris pallida]|uniref:60S ribosomal protein L35a-4 n=1 Tax=Iris pallida TaxID=29817 RepID=A0AAX6G187_IRIPA|nr:60S ribosomal protein L35a-4 [Iris pallida]
MLVGSELCSNVGFKVLELCDCILLFKHLTSVL